MSLQRSPDWRQRLFQIVETAREAGFEWGRLDCALHVCDAIRAMTGIDPGEKYRGTYSDEAGAIAIYGSDLASFAASIAAELGFPEVHVNFARRGDVVWIDNGTEHGALAIVSLDGRFASCAGEKGMLLVPLRRWRRAWQVG